MNSQHGERGRLFVVGTPIGNLQDITLRAVETLKDVAVVVAEDTRRTRALLSHLGISKKRLLAVDAHASDGRIAKVVAALLDGQDVALVTDAGMPSVSDPGATLVGAARAQGIAVEVVPGPSAVTTAAAVSGLVEGPFWFAGFLPRKGKKRREALERIRDTHDAVILFEAPSRLHTTLAELAKSQPTRNACVCRELTKLHEESQLGSLAELVEASILERGEFTLVLAPVQAAPAVETPEACIAEMDAMLEAGSSVRDIARELAERTGHSRRDLFQLALTRRGKDS